MFRDSDVVRERAEWLCKSSSPHERMIGAEMTARVNRSNAQRGSRILTSTIRSDADTGELQTILKWLANFGWQRVVGIRKVYVLASHPSARVRLGVVNVLANVQTCQSLRTLITLTRDANPRVRDWATFSVGELRSEDSPTVRTALAERLEDEDGDTFCEAVYGLAKRRDPRAFELLRDEFESDDPGSLLFRAASVLKDARLLPHLIQLRRRNQNVNEIDPLWLMELRAAIAELREIAENEQAC